MQSVNLDLLRVASSHHPDGTAKDPHAHHRAEHLAALAEDRRQKRHGLIRRVLRLLRRAPKARNLVSSP